MNYFCEPTDESVQLFRTTGEKCIIQPEHLGIANGALTIGTPHTYVTRIEGLFGPPYASSDFLFEVRLFGDRISTKHWSWYPNMIFRSGEVNQITVSTMLTMTANRRNAVMSVALHNNSCEAVTVPWTIHIDGGLDYVHDWAFPIPKTPSRGNVLSYNNCVMMKNSGKAYAIQSSIIGMKWFASARLWETEMVIPAGSTECVTFSFSIGPMQFVQETLNADIKQYIESAFDDLKEKTDLILSKIPKVDSSNEDFRKFYYRALLPFFLNVWKVEEFVLNPYFSTGSVNGGCLASYLWDFSAGAKILPMFNPKATKAQIKAYFHINIFRSYAILPVSGNANGPWYPVNQEKIVDMVYQYVNITGDIAFLHDKVDGKTILQWVNENAYFGCEGDDIELIDYGVDGESHLELRKGIPYHGIMPDLNARRYETFIKVAELKKLCGESNERLLKLAEELKKKIAETLWSEEEKWFWFISEGKKDLRYTVQMFKFCDSDVLSEPMRNALLSHLNEKEFLSDYGLHSMSKLDTAYDQIDIDNGGGGICSIFPILIAEKLYGIKKYDMADDVIRRILWWGTRMPYWGDSFVANYVEYRHDTPLQCTIGSITGAQYVLFGICGLKASANGKITICPHKPNYLKDLKIDDIHIHGVSFGVEMIQNEYKVFLDGQEHICNYGEVYTVR